MVSGPYTPFMVLIQRSSVRLKELLLHTTFECPNMTFDTVLLFSYGYPRLTDPTEASCVTVLLAEVRAHRRVYKTS